jgi:hypothetical protein
MIPYDDLVAALSNWRARKGLPVSAFGKAGGTPVAAAAPGSGPSARAQSPVAEELHDVDEVLDENTYDNEGNDFGASFGESTAERPTDTRDPRKRGEDW